MGIWWGILVEEEGLLSPVVPILLNVMSNKSRKMSYHLVHFMEFAVDLGEGVVGGQLDVEVVPWEWFSEIMLNLFLVGKRSLLKDGFGVAERHRSLRGVNACHQQRQSQKQTKHHIQILNRLSICLVINIDSIYSIIINKSIPVQIPYQFMSSSSRRLL